MGLCGMIRVFTDNTDGCPCVYSIVIGTPSTETCTGNRVYACCSPLACRTARFTLQCVRLLRLFSAITVPTCSCALRSLRAAHSGQMTSLLTRVTNGVCVCSRSSRRSSFARHSVYSRHRGLSLPLEVFGVLVCAL